MKLRIRSRTGVETLTIDPSWTLAHLKAILNATTLRAGYPPHVVDAPDELPVTTLFSDGDIIVVSATAATPPMQTLSTTTQLSTPKRDMVIRVVPDDNSCLFRSVNALLSKPNTSTAVYALRQEVSLVVAGAPMLYNEAFLGRSNADYCAWIMSDSAWGGAIELSILAERFAVEIAAFDLKTMRLDRYGEGRGFGKVGYLVYDGIHYNYAAEARTGMDVTLFDVTDKVAMNAARAIAQKEHDGKKFTDTANFSLRCEDCGEKLTGERQASIHAQTTGHSNFAEK